ncbi:MAG: tetratricopeptide repeat protein [Bacteroidota bacterium]
MRGATRAGRWLVLALLAVGASAQTPLAGGLRAYSEGRFDEAIRLLDDARRSEPSRRDVYAPLAVSLAQVGDKRRAEAVADDGLRRFPDDTALLLVKGEMLVQRDALADAVPIYERLAQREVDEVPRAQIVGRLQSLLRTLVTQRFESGDARGAAEWSRAALHREPSDPALHHALASALAQDGRPGEALAAAEAGLRVAPDDLRLLDARGGLLLQAGDAEGALAPLAAVYADDSTNVEVGLRYAMALVGARNPRRAGEVVEGLLAVHPRDLRIYEALVAINRRMRYTSGVIAALRRRLAVFPDDAEARVALAETYEAVGRWEAARGVYDTLGTTQPERARLAIARTYEAEGDRRTAAELYRDLDVETNGRPEVLRALGRIYEGLGAWPDVREVTDRLLTEEPTADAWARRARAAWALRRPQRALDAYRQSLALDPDLTNALLGLATVLLSQGDTTAAFERATHAVRQGLADVEAARAIIQPEGSVQVPPPPDGEPVSPAVRLARIDALADSAFAFWSASFDPARTEPILQGLLTATPDWGRVQYLAGTHYARHDDLARAETHWTEAARLAPRHRPTHLALGRLHEQQGRLDRATLDYERARSLDEDTPDAYRALVRVSRQRGTLDALLDSWRLRLRSTPRNDVLRAELVDALNRAGRYEEAADLRRDS